MAKEQVMTQEFEYVIVGSGVAGSTVAKGLLEHNRATSILILEAGPEVEAKNRRYWWDYVVQANGREVRTVEGLAPADEPLTPIQAAFHEQHGLQCGFCTPGFLMSLTGLAEQDGPVGTDDLDEHLSGNYCRCTGYVNIRKAARQAFGLPEPDGGER